MPGATINEAAPIHRISDHIGDSRSHRPSIFPGVHLTGPTRSKRASPGRRPQSEPAPDPIRDRYEYGKSPGQAICTAAGRPMGV
jgi:hypothetical protein